jgi:alkylation response protein AidB-like acyl-CoA dehydrogenase
MDFEPRYTQEQEDFRQEVRRWLRENMLPGIEHPADSADLTYEQYQLRRELGRKLGNKGWLWPSAPKEYGGGGLSVDHAVVLEEEIDSYGLTLPPYYDSGGRLGGNSILVWGDEEQKQFFLPKIFRGEVRTWQLLSEPEAGSDLANVKTLARRDGDEFVINGQKVFVGSAHGCDYM